DPATKSPGASFFTGLEGAAAFRAGKRPAVSGIQTPDDTHLVFQLTEPSTVFPYCLAMTFAAPVAREAVEKARDRFDEHPVPAGPFRVERWVRGQFLELARTAPAAPPLPQRIHLDLRVAEATQLTRFNTRALDVTSGAPFAEIPRLLEDP